VRANRERAKPPTCLHLPAASLGFGQTQRPLHSLRDMVGSCRCHHHHHFCNNWPSYYRPARMFRFRMWIVRKSETRRGNRSRARRNSPSRRKKLVRSLGFSRVSCQKHSFYNQSCTAMIDAALRKALQIQHYLCSTDRDPALLAFTEHRHNHFCRSKKILVASFRFHRDKRRPSAQKMGLTTL
jgi:hypothetical protein